MSKVVNDHRCSQKGFFELLAEIDCCPAKEAQSHIDDWRQRLDQVWPPDTVNQEFAKELVNRLPLKKNRISEHFFDLVLTKEIPYRAVDLFLCHCAHTRLLDYDPGKNLAVDPNKVIAGYINLETIAHSSHLAKPGDALFTTGQTLLQRHWLCLAAIVCVWYTVVEPFEGIWRFRGLTSFDGTFKWPSHHHEIPSARDVASLDLLIDETSCHVTSFDSPLPEFLAYLTGIESRTILRSYIERHLDSVQWRESLEHVIGRHWFEDSQVSNGFRERLTTPNRSEVARQKPDNREILIRLWTLYLVPDDAFEFCWYVLTDRFDTGNFGTSVRNRLDTLGSLLLEAPGNAEFHPYNDRSQYECLNWREWFRDFFTVLCGLITDDRPGHLSPERWIRQLEAIELLEGASQYIPHVITGILAFAKESWDVLDPIVLGLPSDVAEKYLREYIRFHPELGDDYFHARYLLAHLRGEVPISGPPEGRSGLLSAVEHLIKISRTRIPDMRSTTWLADSGIEQLWYGAIQQAITEFAGYLSSQYGHDEHEHVAILADKLVTQLNSTNKTVSEWLRVGQSLPLHIRTSVRRLARTAPNGIAREGGECGLQADFGILMSCHLPDRMKTKRLTLVQAKKLKCHRDRGWAPCFHFSSKELLQMRRLLELSPEAHYLFLIHPHLGLPSMVLPALTVSDSSSSCRGGVVPLSVIRHGGMPVTEFILHGIIGLWAGDKNPELIRQCKGGDTAGQGPRILIDIEVTGD